MAHLGVRDTVKAAGLLRPASLRRPYTHSLPNAARIRHAVSLDQLRRPYREFLVRPRDPGPDTGTSTAEEVWFAGAHCDVGGTFEHAPDAPLLSTIPLKWITDGVCDDLDFRPGAYGAATAATEVFADAPVHHNGAAWILVGRRARPVPPEAVLRWSVRLRREQNPGYRPDLAARERRADPDWFKPSGT